MAYKDLIIAETYEEAIISLGELQNRNLTLFLWVDSNPNCTPITKMFKLIIPDGVSNKVSKDILDAINSKFWIISIMDEQRNIFVINEAKKYANKKCEVN